MRYDAIRVGKPRINNNNNNNINNNNNNNINDIGQKLTPQMCRVSMDTYCAPIFVDLSYPQTGSIKSYK